MNPNEIISSGKALGELGAATLLGVIVVALAIACVWLARGWLANSKEAGQTYISLLREQFSDAARRKDLFDEIGKLLDMQAQAIRDLRNDLAAAKQDLSAIRSELLQRLRP